MTKDEQALKWIAIANDLQSKLDEEGLFEDTYGISNGLDIHVDDVLFATIARLSKCEVTPIYQSAAFHGAIKVGAIKFSVCHNLL